MTEYVVLVKMDGAWQILAKEPARSSRSAISRYLDGREEFTSGEYAAVPARSWKPITVKVETKTAMKFS